MKKIWFKKFGWIYRPISWQGTLATVLLMLFMFQVFAAVDRRSHSVSDTLYGIFPFWVPAILAWLWIGLQTSSKE